MLKGGSSLLRCIGVGSLLYAIWVHQSLLFREAHKPPPEADSLDRLMHTLDAPQFTSSNESSRLLPEPQLENQKDVPQEEAELLAEQLATKSDTDEKKQAPQTTMPEATVSSNSTPPAAPTTSTASVAKTLSFDGSDNAYRMRKDQPLLVRKDYNDRNPNCTLDCEMQNMTFLDDLHKSLVREFLVAESKWLLQTDRQDPATIAKRYNLTRQTNLTEYCQSESNTFEWIPSSAQEPPTRPVAREGRMPKLIFQSWKTNDLDEMNCNHAREWSKMNPTFDYFLFDDDAVERFLQVEFGPTMLEAYRCIIPGAAKIDVWRLFVVYIYGGFYIDFDSSPVVPFHEWQIPQDVTVVTGNGRGCELKQPKSDPRGCPHQWALVYEEGHGILRQAILGVLKNLADRRARRTMSIAFYPYIRAFWAHANVHSASDPRYMPGWGDEMGGRLLRDGKNGKVKQEMRKTSSHWQTVDGKRGSYDKRNIWKAECLND